jgi:Abortive infection C-terminus
MFGLLAIWAARHRQPVALLTLFGYDALGHFQGKFFNDFSHARGRIHARMVDPGLAILSGLATVVEGIGALRTHGGDAHGRERGYKRLDRRIASLAIHAASTIALFLIETWQRKYPKRDLHRAMPDAPTRGVSA